MSMNVGDFAAQAGISSAFSAASNAAGALIGQAFAGRTAALDYDYWQKKIDYQNQLNIENWNRQNAYNLPSAQVGRLRAAGLAPELMYQNGGSSGIASDIQSSSPGSNNLGVPQVMMNPMSMAQMDNLSADSELKRSQADLNNTRQGVEGVLKNVYETQANLNKATESLLGLEKIGQDLKNTAMDLQNYITNYNIMLMQKKVTVPIMDYKTGKWSEKKIEFGALPLFERCMAVSAASISRANDARVANDYVESLRASFRAIVEQYKLDYGEEGVKRLQAEATRWYYGMLKKPYSDKYFETHKPLSLRYRLFYNDVKRANNYWTDTFDGSTTEWIQSWFPAVGSFVGSAVGSFFGLGGLGKFGAKSVGKAAKSFNIPFSSTSTF